VTKWRTGSPISSYPPSLLKHKETCVLTLVPAPNQFHPHHLPMLSGQNHFSNRVRVGGGPKKCSDRPKASQVTPQVQPPPQQSEARTGRLRYLVLSSGVGLGTQTPALSRPGTEPEEPAWKTTLEFPVRRGRTRQPFDCGNSSNLSTE
jgi:hypothetical protein